MARPTNPQAQGEARAAILEAATELLEKGGPAELSMREIARRAGVSHQTPNHHFKSRDALLSELVTSGFQELDRSMADAMASSSEDPRDQVVACGMGYVLFALRRKGLFKLMWQHDDVTTTARPRMNEAYDASYRRLVGAIGRLHHVTPEDPDVQLDAAVVWSAIHGLTVLVVDDVLKVPDANAFARSVVQRVSDLLVPLMQRPPPAAKSDRPAKKR